MSRETKLLLHALLGDTLALQRLLLVHAPKMHDYIQKHMPAHLRDELPSEVVLYHAMARVSASLPHLPATDADYFDRWLLTIARQTLASMISEQGVKKTITDLSISADSYSASTVRRLKLAKLIQAIDSLPAPIRSVIRMRYMQGLVDEDIAKGANITLQQVQELCEEGLRLLREKTGSAVHTLTQ